METKVSDLLIICFFLPLTNVRYMSVREEECERVYITSVHSINQLILGLLMNSCRFTNKLWTLIEYSILKKLLSKTEKAPT